MCAAFELSEGFFTEQATIAHSAHRDHPVRAIVIADSGAS
jgi:hypothetical protein